MELRLATCRSAQLKAWTGLSGPQLHALITRLWRRRPDSGCGRPWSLDFGDRVLLVVLGYRTNLTMKQPAALFATTDSTVHRVTADLAPHLAALLGPPPTDRRELWLVDGTLIPVHHQKKTKKSKNYRRSVNVQIVCRARDRRIVAVGDAWPGNRNDVVVPAWSSNTPLRTVVSLTAAACATARTPPCPRPWASAAINSRRCRSSRCGSNTANFTASWSRVSSGMRIPHQRASGREATP